jgi:ribosomal protein L11
LLKEAANYKSGSGTPNKVKVGTITAEDVRKLLNIRCQI